MFSLFKKKASIKITDKVYLSEQAKFSALEKIIQEHPDTIFIAWFEQTKNKFTAFLNQKGVDFNVYLTREVASKNLPNFVFIEHFPLFEKEMQFFESFESEISVYSALDEPFLAYFLNNNVTSLLQKMGADENECMDHKMITNAIQNIQKKLDKEVLIDSTATSQEDWMRKNTLPK